METCELPGLSRAAGQTLGALSPAQEHGVQIDGVRRGGLRILNPSAHERLHAGDEVLILGTPVQIREFKQCFRERAEEAGATPAG